MDNLHENASRSNCKDIQRRTIIPKVHISPLSDSLPNARASGGRKMRS